MKKRIDLFEFLSQLENDEFEGYMGITYENGKEHLAYRLGSEEFFAIEEEVSMEIKIRKWKNEDKTELAEILNNRNILNNLRDGVPYPYTEKDAEDFIGAMLSADPDKTFAFAITLDDKVIGSIGIFRQENIHYRTAELGYYIGEKYWGNGYMTEAVKQASGFVFENSDIIRIYAEPFAYNAGSCRVLEKAGFVYEGTLRSNVYKNGSITDMKMYALVKQ